MFLAQIADGIHLKSGSICLNGDHGDIGQILVSQGYGNMPAWADAGTSGTSGTSYQPNGISGTMYWVSNDGTNRALSFVNGICTQFTNP